jgi:hypothetical protein
MQDMRHPVRVGRHPTLVMLPAAGRALRAPGPKESLRNRPRQRRASAERRRAWLPPRGLFLVASVRPVGFSGAGASNARPFRTADYTSRV